MKPWKLYEALHALPESQHEVESIATDSQCQCAAISAKRDVPFNVWRICVGLTNLECDFISGLSTPSASIAVSPEHLKPQPGGGWLATSMAGDRTCRAR